MLVEIKNWPGKKNHSLLHGSTVTCLSMVIIILKTLNLNEITILLENGVMVKKPNNLPNLEFTR